MNPSSQLPFKPRIPDPRRQADFDPARYPAASGGAIPPTGRSDPLEPIQNQFLAVYYHLNVAHAALLHARAERDGSPGSERNALRRIERALRWRDTLEDYYAPFGIIAEPQLKQGFALKVRFTFGAVTQQGFPRSQGYRMSAYISLPSTT
jgi:hypothetical protein